MSMAFAARLAALEARCTALEERLHEQMKMIEELQRRMKSEPKRR